MDSDDSLQSRTRIFEQIEAGTTILPEADFMRLIIAVTRNQFFHLYR